MRAIVNNPLANRTRVFLGPSITSTMLGALKNGAVVDVLNQTDGWAHIVIKAGDVLLLDDASMLPLTGHVNQKNLLYDRPPIVFQSNANTIPSGGTAMLSWSVSSIAGVWLQSSAGINTAVPGTMPDWFVSPTVTTSYWLRVQDVDGTTRESPRITVTVTPYVPGGRPGIGVHHLTSIKSYNMATAAGCKVHLFMDRPDEAVQAATGNPRTWTPDSAYPLVMYRKYHEAQPWSPAQMVSSLDGLTNNPNPQVKNVIITLWNEWDAGIPGAGNTAAGMSQFCDWTIEALGLLRAKGFANVAWLTSSVGTPEFMYADVCAVIKAKIAPLWNSGQLLWTDMHLYSPLPSPPRQMDIWFERRWQWLYDQCGFSPTAPGRIVSSETGLDVSGTGGFPANGYTRERVNQWCADFNAYMGQPLIIGGKWYPSPYMAGAIFQGDPDEPRWAGYDVSEYYPLVWS
jgi:hypothetical protein